MAKKITAPEENKTLSKWQQKYETSKSKYADELNRMVVRENYYEGSRKVKGNPNKDAGEYAHKEAINVRNISYELTESQVDSSIPMAKVTPIHQEDEPLARKIEAYLNAEMKTLGFKEINDMQERTTPVQGASFTLVEWDISKGYHCTLGDLAVSDVHPREVIPQPGVTDIDKMDYFFIRTSQTKEYVKRRFGKDVSDEDETDLEIRDGVASEDIVTVVTAYYKNDKGGIGLYRWCGDVELENLTDYQARHTQVCKKCGKPKTANVCECGSKSFVDKDDEKEIITLFNGTKTTFDMFGNPVIEEVTEEVEIDYYKPNMFPLVMRKNISRDRHLLGSSDVDAISDQQDTVKKLGSQINEKLLMGGSFITLPEDIGIETTDEQFKVIRIPSPDKVAMINVITAQADCSQDRASLEENYQWAKSTLGITDAFQGKYDASATSGSAKQYSINQAAGRLESKRVMKNSAFAKIYEIMFKFALAYADDPVPITIDGTDGELEFTHFDKKEFLKKDKGGEYYWNDEFIFDIDPTSTLLTNREAMWQQADLKLQSGAFGALGDLQTNYLYWKFLEKNGYPNASEVLTEIEKRIEEQKQQAEMQAQQQMQMQQLGGVQNGMQ